MRHEDIDYEHMDDLPLTEHIEWQQHVAERIPGDDLYEMESVLFNNDYGRQTIPFFYGDMHMNTEIDERGLQFLTGVCEFKDQFPRASWHEIDRYIEEKLDDIFGDGLPPDQKHSLAAFGRAWRH